MPCNKIEPAVGLRTGTAAGIELLGCESGPGKVVQEGNPQVSLRPKNQYAAQTSPTVQKKPPVPFDWRLRVYENMCYPSVDVEGPFASTSVATRCAKREGNWHRQQKKPPVPFDWRLRVYGNMSSSVDIEGPSALNIGRDKLPTGMLPGGAAVTDSACRARRWRWRRWPWIRAGWECR